MYFFRTFFSCIIKMVAKKLQQEKIFQTGIRNTLKQVHPELMISGTAILELSSCLYTLVEELILNSTKITCNTKTIKSKDMYKSVEVTLTGELHKHANHEGQKATVKYNSFVENKRFYLLNHLKDKYMH
jgi:hypothetical protein